MQRLPALGPDWHQETNHQAEQGQELHKVTHRRGAERDPFAVGRNYLEAQKPLTDRSPPGRAFHESAVQPGSHRQDRDVRKTRKHFSIPAIDSDYAPEVLQHEIDRKRYQQRSECFQDNIHGSGQEPEPESGVLDVGRNVRHAPLWEVGRVGRLRCGLGKQVAAKQTKTAIGQALAPAASASFFEHRFHGWEY